MRGQGAAPATHNIHYRAVDELTRIIYIYIRETAPGPEGVPRRLMEDPEPNKV